MVNFDELVQGIDGSTERPHELLKNVAIAGLALEPAVMIVKAKFRVTIAVPCFSTTSTKYFQPSHLVKTGKTSQLSPSRRPSTPSIRVSSSCDPRSEGVA